MKRIVLVITLAGLLLPFVPRAQADTAVSLNFFYDNLSTQGSWLEVGDYGYCFQPSVAVNSPDWRPYADGYWAYTDLGWTWVSYEDFGWATYHYGRWANLESYGWVWVPGYEWGPAWVSWRTGGDYVGWAPLPPTTTVYEGRAITGPVDIQFGIGPLYYNFVDIRYIGEPVLRGRILPPSRNVTIINRTVNVTNITYNNSVGYNYGPDYNRVNQYSTRPVQRLTIQRETTVGNNLGQDRKGNFNRVSGNQLTVVAPPVQRTQEKAAPRQVKARVEKPNLETGWKGINNRQQVEAEMKKGDPKNIPAPDIKPKRDRKADTVAGAQRGNEDQTAAGQDQRRANGANRQSGQQAQGNRHGKPDREEARQQVDGRGHQRGQAQETENAHQTDGQQDDSRTTRSGKAERNPDSDAARQQSSRDQDQQAQHRQRQQQDRVEESRSREAQPESDAARQQSSHHNGQQAQHNRDQVAERARGARQPEQANDNQPTADNRRQDERESRTQTADDAPSRPAARENSDSPSQAQRPAKRPEHPQHSQAQQRAAHQQEQARPQQHQERQQSSDNPRHGQKGKKKKANEEPPPQS